MEILGRAPWTKKTNKHHLMGDPPILIVLVVFFCFWISSYPDGFGFFGFVFFVFCLFLVLPSIAQKTENCDVGAALVHQPSFALCSSFLAIALVACAIAAAKPKQSPKDDWEYLI